MMVPLVSCPAGKFGTMVPPAEHVYRFRITALESQSTRNTRLYSECNFVGNNSP